MSKLKDYDLDIDDLDVKTTDMANIFNVYVDKKNKYVYNLNSTIYFNVNTSDLKTYTVKDDMFWPLISYHIYGTTRMSWILMKLNGVTQDTMFDMVLAGQKVYYVQDSVANDIIEQINS